MHQVSASVESFEQFEAVGAFDVLPSHSFGEELTEMCIRDRLQPEQIISPANKIARDRNNIFLIMNRLFRELFQISSLLLIK